MDVKRKKALVNKSVQKYYSLEPVLLTGCEYLLLLGERANGKSYAVKTAILWEAYHKCDYYEFLKTGKMVPKRRYKFGYVRRFKEEMRGYQIEEYFGDMNISQITEGNYDCVVFYQGDIYFGRHLDDDSIERCCEIGKAFGVSRATLYKSLSYPEIGNIVYEEFVTDEGYLPDECRKFMNLISTIARRDKVRVFLVANTVSRHSPYFREWGLTHIMRQKQGTIEIYTHHTDQIDENGDTIDIRIAVEYCENSGTNSQMFFGNSAKMITSGSWETREYPHIPDHVEYYKNLYSVYYKYDWYQFCLNILKRDKELFVYVHPINGRKPKSCRRVITDEFSGDKLYSDHLTVITKYDNILVDLLNKGKICFSDNLTGTEFYQLRKDRGGY